MIMRAARALGGASLAVAFLALVPASACAAPTVFGRWMTDDRSAIVNIRRCGERACGAIERVLDPAAPRNDVNNPAERLRSKPLKGTLVLRDFEKAGGRWQEGMAYDPKSGRSYDAKLEALDNGKLKVTGCVLLFCRSRLWSRPG